MPRSAAMRRVPAGLATVALLAGPAALGFFAGGYFTFPRLWAVLVAWTVVAGLAVAGPAPLPRSGAGRAAAGGLALLTAWTLASVAWAPLAGLANESAERMLLYTGAFLAAIGLARHRAIARALEPAFALGAAVTISYGLAGRLLPRLVVEHPSNAAGDRLDQPITYWNAEGALAAMGLVLCARLAGDRTRPIAVRALAAAACAPLGAGVYLTYSRGALAACAAGLLVLLAIVPDRPQGRATALATAAAVAAAAATALFGSVARLEGSLATRQHDGTLVLLLVLAIALAAGLATRWLARGEAAGRRPLTPLPGASRLRLVALAAVLLAVGGLVVGGLGERSHGRSTDPQIARTAGSGRLTSVSSRRYDYWRAGLRAWRAVPVRGLGAAGFQVAWLRYRPVREGTLEVHSLELEMLVELGLVGLALFAVFAGGTGLAVRRAVRAHPETAAGAAAAVAVYLMHATIDWDWQIPAVTLPALILAAGLVVSAEAAPPARGYPLAA